MIFCTIIFFVLLLRYKVYSYSNDTNAWFSEAVGRPCTLLRYSGSNHEFVLDKTKDVVSCKDTNSAVSFANEGQFLLVSEESVSDLNKRLCSGIFLYPWEFSQRHMLDWKSNFTCS